MKAGYGRKGKSGRERERRRAGSLEPWETDTMKEEVRGSVAWAYA